mgnify:CR=1 FL=1
MKLLEKKLLDLTKHHYLNSQKYKKIIDSLFAKKSNNLENIPFLPINLFKDLNLKSIPDKNVFKILHSSGTSGNVSKIFLDKNNAQNQTKALNDIISKLLGKERIPMLILDQKINFKDKNKFNAKIAAIIGFSIFGKNIHYLLNENNEIDYVGLNNFLKLHGKKKFFVFGFTNNVYENLIQKLDQKNIISNFENGILLHAGGWKKMENKKIDNEIFKSELFKKFNFLKIINYYGLIEQTGSIFLECEKCGNFYSSKYSTVIIRGKNFEVLPEGKKGFIQLLSILPTSYPGHSILTEDMGSIVKNNCSLCFGKKSFLVHGRAKKSEIRGCSDAQ